jgi:hypothetical protein
MSTENSSNSEPFSHPAKGAKRGRALPRPEPNPDVPVSLKLEQKAFEQGTLVAIAEQDFEARLAELIPTLVRVHDEIAQRAGGYKKNPDQTWTAWLKNFLKRTGIKRCSKTIGRKIKAHLERNSTSKYATTGSAASTKSAADVFKSKITEPVNARLDDAPAGQERETAEAMVRDFTDAIRTKLPGIQIQVSWDDVAPELKPTDATPARPADDGRVVRKLADNKTGHQHHAAASGPDEPSLKARAATPDPHGEAALQADLATTGTEKEPSHTTQPKNSAIAPNTDAQPDFPRAAVATAATGEAQFTDRPKPQPAASKLSKPHDETIDCVTLEPAPDGGHKAVVSPEALKEIKSARARKEYMLSGPVDLFGAAVGFDVLRKLFSGVWRVQESQFRLRTIHPERAHAYAEWELSQNRLWRFPPNLSICASVQSGLDLHKLDVFAEISRCSKSVSFVGFTSNPEHPLVPGQVFPSLRRCELREILIDRRPKTEGPYLTHSDAACMSMIAGWREMGCEVIAI